jgi:hypothetical protein
MMRTQDCAYACLAKLPAAVSGQGGHTATCGAAFVLVKTLAVQPLN